MADPQTPAPPAPPAPAPAAAPFWRRVAQFAGIDDEIDAVSAAARMAGGWVQSKLPQLSPEAQAAYDRAATEQTKREAQQAQARQATWKAIADPVKEFGRQLYDRNQSLVTPDADVRALADAAQQTITERSDATRAALPKAPGLQPLDWMVGAQQDWLPKMLVDQVADASTSGGVLSNVDLPGVGPALHAVGAGAGHLLAGLPPGFYSRVDRIAEAVGKKGIHPNKLASLLKSGASTEEVTYRNLPELLASKGNQLITKDELAAHLAAHPPPDITRSVLGAETDPAHVHAARDLIAHGTAPEDVLPALQQAYRGASEAALRDAIDAVSIPNYPAGPPKYNTYKLPGGERYQEALTQLRPPEAARSASASAMTPSEQFEFAPRTGSDLYRTSHFDQPNILVHARSNERTLAGPAGPPVPPFVEPAPGAAAAEGYTVRVDREDPYTGTRQMTLLDPQGEWAGSRGMTRLTPEQYLHETAVDRAKTAYKQTQQAAAAPSGARGRFLEEVQSDWHQAGKKSGYADPIETSRDLHNAGAALREAEIDHATRLQEITGGRLTPDEVLFLSQVSEPGDTTDQLLARIPERASWHPGVAENVPEFQARARTWLDEQTAAGQRSPVSAAWNGMNALSQTQRAVDEAHVALQAVRRRQQKLVPDAPFKEAWPELALKQHLIDVAHRPDLSWLGFTSGKTQVNRYGSERLTWAPEGTGFRVRYEPQVGGDALGGDLGEDALARGLITNRDRFVADPEDLATLLGDSDVKAEKAWKRIQAQPEGGTYLPRKEGMEAYYDRALPGKLQKLVAPFGGTVEPGEIPAGTKSVAGEVRGWRVVDSHGTEVGTYADEQAARYVASQAAARLPTVRVVPTTMRGEQVVEHSEPGWIARLSPEAKAQIREKGFPLMSFLPPVAVGAAAAGAAASQLGGEDDPGAAAVPTFELPRGFGTLAGRAPRGFFDTTRRPSTTGG